MKEILNKISLFKLGVKRIDRWNWANSHKLNPSKKVKELIEKNLNDPNYTERYFVINKIYFFIYKLKYFNFQTIAYGINTEELFNVFQFFFLLS